MIWIRRFLTVPFGLLLLVLLAVALVALQASDSFLDPGFYPRELSKANIYEFALVDLSTSLLNEARQLDQDDLPEELDENPVVVLGLSTEDIVSSLNRAIPPEWVQSVVEQVFEEPGRYVTGERDEFEVTIEAGEQVAVLAAELKTLLRRANAYDLLFTELVDPAVRDALAEKLPLGLDVTGDQMVRSVRRVIPPEWVQTQVEMALDEIASFLVEKRESFEVKVELADRVEAALAEVKGLLRETDAYELLYAEVIEPAVADRLGQSVQLPLGISVSREEVLLALRQVAPVEWVQEQAERVIDEAGPYLAGETDTFAVHISLEENKREARRVIVDTATRKLSAAIDPLPVCTIDQITAALAIDDLRELPECIPPGLQPDQVVRQLEGRIIDLVDPAILTLIPDDIQFTEAQLRETLLQAGAKENVDLLDDTRKLIGDGWTYTYDDLQDDVQREWGDEGKRRLDDARAFLADGWTYTEDDLRHDIEQAGGADALSDFDRGRTNLNRAKTFRLLIYLPALVVLIIIGFLGGRSWRHRFAWAAAFLALSGLLLFLASGPLYSAFGESALEDGRETAFAEIDFDSNFSGTQRLLVDKGFDVGISVVGDFASGIAAKSLILLGVGLVLLVASLGWGTIARFGRRQRPGEPSDRTLSPSVDAPGVDPSDS